MGGLGQHLTGAQCATMRGKLTMYQIIDRQTGAIVGTAKTRQTATRKRDRLDNEYGAYRYYVKEVI